MTANRIVLPGQDGLSSLLIWNEDDNIYVDLLPSCDSFILVESIDRKAITASCIISDLTDIFNRLPLKGDEIIIAKWEVETNTSKELVQQECILRITNISNIGFDAERPGVGIEINMISEYGYKEAFINVEEAFSGTIYETALDTHNRVITEFVGNEGVDLYGKEVNALTADKTLGVFDFIIPGETPFDTMDYLTGWASNQETSKSDIWCYFQSTKGFQFTNIEALFAKETDDAYAETHTYSLLGAINPTDKEAQYAISGMRQLNRNSLFNLASTGRFRNEVKELSYTHKRVVTTEYDYFDQDYGIEGSDMIASDKFKNSIATIPTETHWVYRDNTRSDFFVNDFLPHKWAMNRLIRNNTVQIQVPGNPDLAAGDIIELKINRPFATGKNKERPIDTTVSGKYIIKDLIHTFGPSSYQQDITLIRPGAADASKVEE